MKASARKSQGRYKPLIVHASGRTEILGQRSRPLLWRGAEPLPDSPRHSLRGLTFPTRDEAVAYAVTYIARTQAVHERRTLAFAARMWRSLSAIGVDERGRLLARWRAFDAGTDREAVWQWLSRTSGVPVARLKQVTTETPAGHRPHHLHPPEETTMTDDSSTPSADARSESEPHAVTVRVVPLVDETLLSEDDRDLPLEHPIDLPASVPRAERADTALDRFHEEVAVEYPEHFEFEVWEKGVQLHTGPAAPDYAADDEGPSP